MPTRERRDRDRRPREGRHRGDPGGDRFSAGFAALGRLAYSGAQVSAHAVDLATGTVLVGIDERIVLPTASAGKVLLLIEVAARIAADASVALTIIDRTADDEVGRAGVWRDLRVPALPMTDLAALVGATGDALAMNALCRQVGLESVRARTESLGLARTALLDIERDGRGPDDAPQVSVGSTAEFTWLMTALHRGQIVDRVVSRQVLSWLSRNADLSMAASAFGLAPLVRDGSDHGVSDHGVSLISTTGADAGVRCDVGLLAGPRAGLAYALTVQFDDDSIAKRLEVVDAMRTFGTDMLEYVTTSPSPHPS